MVAWLSTVYFAFSRKPVERANQRGVFLKMIKFINAVLLIINIISCVVAALVGIFGIIEQIVGAGCAERLLKKFNIPLSYRQIFFIGLVSVALMIITYILRRKLTGKPL